MNAPFHPPLGMPPKAPMSMPAQDLRKAPPTAPLRRDGWRTQLARGFVFGITTLITAALGAVLYDWFQAEGLQWVELGVMVCGLFAAFWIALSVATAILGCLPRRALLPDQGGPLDVAIVQPIYGEAPQPIVTAIEALLRQLTERETPHRFTYYCLSDTREPAKVVTERLALADLAQRLPGVAVHYRHRAQNHRFKVGNIEDWVTQWGGAHEAMLVLDADSVMTAESVLLMADMMATRPRLGLVQSIPRLLEGTTIFGRMQAFSNAVYGTTLARGLALWAGSAANYWGHNALIRVAAFARAAGLPNLPGRRPFGGVILSHDFVEAALLRRAGWRICFLPQAIGSFETTPQSVIGHVLRDQRWCQGNLQHLRLLGVRGLHPISRMHMFQGAMAYLTSVVWFVLMGLWVLIGTGQGDGAIQYFSETNPLFPAWPEMELVSRILIVSLTYGMLIAPKLMGAMTVCLGDPSLRSVGGWRRFWLSVLIEVVLSVLLAPMMMVQHMVAVGRTLLGFDTGWKTAVTRQGLFTCIRFHALEMVLGLVMCGLFIAGALTMWLVPVAVSLLLAPLLSWATATAPRWALRALKTPQDASGARAAAPQPKLARA